MKKFFIIIILFTGCSYSDNKVENKSLDIDFYDLSFQEFQNKLNEYAQNNPYPNIDE